MRKQVFDEPSPHEPKLGDKRKVFRFLFLPLTLSVSGTNRKERRWLEIVQIDQEYTWQERYCNLPSKNWCDRNFSF